MKSNYWYTREQQRKAYRKQLIKAYAPLAFLIAVAVVMLCLH
jgi:hypothetical protein